MIALITAVNAFAAARLILGILRNKSFDTAGQLLAIGAIVWLTNVNAFALSYGHLDGGGAAAWVTGSSKATPGFVFPEMTLTEFAPPDWYAQFADYLTLSFNTATAFSPTDVSAVKRWAKLMMITESVVSLSLIGLVVARAVNIL